MEQISSAQPPRLSGALKPVAWLGGALATAAAAAVAAVLAIVFAASLVVMALIAGVLLVFAGLALRARRTVRRSDGDVIEAHSIDGQSWVAYGWDRRGR
ncbi:MAG TPA: hypothetical protein VJP88_00820 [Caulobacteraceae bacterium]|nr:hypothetical protein [Caulobacteraceae bacterium]